MALKRTEGANTAVCHVECHIIPSATEDPKIGYSTVNARAETVNTSPTFREAMKRRRCLVPATGFYGWQKIGNKAKQPWTIELPNGEVFAFAGLWDRWKDRVSGNVLETYTIITTDPNELVHDHRHTLITQRMSKVFEIDLPKFLSTEGDL